MSQKTVLIVEDNPNQRALYEDELSEQGYHVVTAADGRAALGIAREQRLDLVVLDINMPVMDGLDTLSQLLEYDHRIKVVINTAYASYQDSFTSWSADAYVVKSGDLSELKKTVNQLLADAPAETA